MVDIVDIRSAVKKGEIRFTGHKCIKSNGDGGNNLQYLKLKQR